MRKERNFPERFVKASKEMLPNLTLIENNFSVDLISFLVDQSRRGRGRADQRRSSFSLRMRKPASLWRRGAFTLTDTDDLYLVPLGARPRIGVAALGSTFLFR